MPRVSRRKGQECAEHGPWCKRGGGSEFTSERCRPPAVDRYGVRVEAIPTGETAFGLVELLHTASGTPVSRSGWDRLTPARKAAELDGVDTRLAPVLLAARDAYEALHPPRPAHEPAESVAPSAVNPSLSVQRPHEPTGAGVTTTPPALVVELATARKRRRRRPHVSSVNPYGYDDVFHPFRDYDDD